MQRRSWLVLGAVAAIAAMGAVYLTAGDLLTRDRDGGAAAQRAPRALPVQVTEVATRPVRVTAETVGTLVARNEVELTTDAEGLIEEITFEEGQRVEEGELLVALDAQEERAELEAARARRDEISRELERARNLRTSDFATEARVDELEAQLAEAEAEVNVAEAHLAERRIRAPFDGLVGLREVSPGALMMPGTVVTTLSMIDPIELSFDLPAEHLSRLEVGQTVLATSDTLGDEAKKGQISVVDPDVDPATRTVTVEAELPNPEGDLVPGMFVGVEVVLETRPEALVVPEEALLRRGDDTYAFVVGEDGTVTRRGVRTGEHEDGEVEVTEGLRAGERIVVAGLQKIRDGQKVRPMPAGGESGAPQSGGGTS